jgi:hypothetical protein
VVVGKGVGEYGSVLFLALTDTPSGLQQDHEQRPKSIWSQRHSLKVWEKMHMSSACAQFTSHCFSPARGKDHNFSGTSDHLLHRCCDVATANAQSYVETSVPSSPYPRKPLMSTWCPTTHATENRNFGENTVHMNRCSRKAIHATMTLRVLNAVNNVKRAKCSYTAFPLIAELALMTTAVAKTHHIGPAQLLTNVRMPTAMTLKPAMPL